MSIFISNNCTENEVTFIRKKLIEYNKESIGLEPRIEHVRYILHNENNEIVGGITGIIYMDCLTIDLLWVNQDLRGFGYGKKLLNEVENTAKSRNCKRIILDTFSFQAPEFYKRNGYNIYATLEDYPIQNVVRYYFKKDL